MTIQAAFSDSNTMPFDAPIHSQHDSVLSKVSVLLGRDDISGRFSIIDDGPVYIQMEAGMVLHVRAGSVEANQFANRNERSLNEGERFVADRNDLLTVHSHARAELQVDWPAPVHEQ